MTPEINTDFKDTLLKTIAILEEENSELPIVFSMQFEEAPEWVVAIGFKKDQIDVAKLQ